MLLELCENIFYKIIIKDPLNIKNEPININTTRVKVFILNPDDQFVLISAFEGYQLPGGHVEEDEVLTTAVVREVSEETGINLKPNEILIPFFKIQSYKNTDENLNKSSTIIYYFIKTCKSVNIDSRNLTEHEKKQLLSCFKTQNRN